MQLSAEDTYDLAGQIVEISLDKIHPSKHNPRSELGDLEGLAASIREVGVLQPITVFPVGDGTEFEIMYGARRHAASALAMQLVIPSIVLPKPEDGKALLNRIIENLQRQDPSAIDEARAFEQLRDDFDLTQDEIAIRVGCSQSHVTKRLSLLGLPIKARQMVGVKGDDGKLLLTIDDGVELAKLADHPDRLKEALKRVTEQGWDAHSAVRSHLQELAAIAAIADEVEKAKAKGIAVLWTQATYGSNYEDSKKRTKALAGAAQVVKPDTYTSGPALKIAKPTAHAKESCHAITLGVSYNGKVEKTAYCTDTKRHAPKGESDLKAAKAPAAAKRTLSPEEQAENERRAALVAHRREFITEIVRERKLAKGEVVTLALSRVALDGYDRDHTQTAELLGIDLTGRVAEVALTDFIRGGHDQLLRGALASMLVGADAAFISPHLEQLLDTLGYEPSADELAARERDRIEREADEKLNRAYDRAEELDRMNDPAVTEILRELDDNEISIDRADELHRQLDALFATANDLQEGDVVDQADDGTHTIERADEPSDTAVDGVGKAADPIEWIAYGALTANGSKTIVLPHPVGAGTAPTMPDRAGELQLIGTWPTKPAELDVTEALHRAQADAGGTKACAFPMCTLPDEHDGDHRIKLKPFTKAPKDCSADEHFAQMQIVSALEADPDDQELLGLYEELRTGVDDARATEIHQRLSNRAGDTAEAPLEYAKKKPGPMEQSCRELIATLPADDPRVIDLQRELYKGINTGQASAMKKKLKALAGELAKASA